VVDLVEDLIKAKFNLEERSEVLRSICKEAALTLLVLFAAHWHRDHHPPTGTPAISPEDRTIDAETAEALRDLALERIRAAAQDGTLTEKRHLDLLLLCWGELSLDGAAEARRWTDEHLSEDRFVLRLAEALTSMGDAPRVRLDDLDPVLDVACFRARLDEIKARSDLSDEDRAVIDRFREGLRLAAGKR
jgi:hypothetical protein